MKIYVDENVPLKIAQSLRAAGYQVEYVTRSMEDKDILEAAYKQKALLMTSDKDFERLVLNERRPTAGVVLLRIPTRISMEDRAKIVVNMLRVYQEKLQGACTMLTERAVDIRRPLR
jgi:predicted nuclease of predicted toxin-antitoxin system